MTKNIDNRKIKTHKSAVKNWWNSDKTKKWQHGGMYKKDFKNHQHVLFRKNRVLELVSDLNLPKNAKVLELGFGGAELAGDLLKSGYEYTGIDISKHLVNHAKKKYFKFLKNKKAKFINLSLEDKYNFKSNYFDLVIEVGAFQYAGNLTKTLNEIKRVLKVQGFFLMAQSNMYSFNNLMNFRRFVKALIWFFQKKNFFYNYSLSFKDILLSTELTFFKKYKNSKFMNFKFMTNYSEVWKYKIIKRLFSIGKMKKLLKDNQFTVKKVSGGPFIYNSKENTTTITSMLNKTLQFLCDLKFPLIIRFADSGIILASKKSL
tara:strand:- start:472 stop:1422 length:951 start_codon:yes stop_codon:yes gene_type:complete